MQLGMERRCLADHEAGHAVARLVLDQRVGRRGPSIRMVKIIPESGPWPMQHTDRDGRVQQDVEGVVDRDDRCMSLDVLEASRGTPKQEIVEQDVWLDSIEYLAGPVADAISRGWSSQEGWDRGWEQSLWDRDVEQATKRLWWLGRNDPEAAWDEAWALVTAHREAVKALGDVLLHKNELNGEEVEEIVLQAPAAARTAPELKSKGGVGTALQVE
jgi:hypothetical protein